MGFAKSLGALNRVIVPSLGYQRKTQNTYLSITIKQPTKYCRTLETEDKLQHSLHLDSRVPCLFTSFYKKNQLSQKHDDQNMIHNTKICCFRIIFFTRVIQKFIFLPQILFINLFDQITTSPLSRCIKLHWCS